MKGPGRGLYGRQGFERPKRLARSQPKSVRIRPIILGAMLILGMLLSYCVIAAEPFGESNPSSGEWSARSRAGIAPWIRSTPFEPYPVTSAEPADLSFFVRDNDSASLNITWDWGDGTVENSNITFTPATNVRINRTHVYSPVPEPGRSMYQISYIFNLTVEDPDLNSDYDTTVVDCLVNVTNGTPTSLTLNINSTAVDPSDEVYIMASAADPEGEALTWTFKFADDESQVYREVVAHTSTTAQGQTVWNNLTHVFGTEGRHRIYMNISDALPPYQVFPHNLSTSIDVYVAVNSEPAVSPSISADPSTPIIDEGMGYVLVTYVIQSLDIDGDIITATWDFDDGSPPVMNTSAGGHSVYTFTQTRNYTIPGDYNVSVVVSDGREGHEVLRYLLMHVGPYNSPPSLVQISQWNDFGGDAFVGETVTFTGVFTDPEEDALHTYWEFDDGSPGVYINSSSYVGGHRVLISLQHVFSSPGTHTVLISYTDEVEGQYDHDRNTSFSLDVYLDTEGPVADAGEDGLATIGLGHFLDGSGSSDNAGIVNYTWTFVYNGSTVELYGPTPAFVFWTEGTYIITLTVVDGEGHSSTDEVQVTAMTVIPEFSSFWGITLGIAVMICALFARRRR